jgi:hypothetical protein
MAAYCPVYLPSVYAFLLSISYGMPISLIKHGILPVIRINLMWFTNIFYSFLFGSRQLISKTITNCIVPDPKSEQRILILSTKITKGVNIPPVPDVRLEIMIDTISLILRLSHHSNAARKLAVYPAPYC